MGLDGVDADEETGSNLTIRQPLADKHRNATLSAASAPLPSRHAARARDHPSQRARARLAPPRDSRPACDKGVTRRMQVRTRASARSSHPAQALAPAELAYARARTGSAPQDPHEAPLRTPHRTTRRPRAARGRDEQARSPGDDRARRASSSNASSTARASTSSPLRTSASTRSSAHGRTPAAGVNPSRARLSSDAPKHIGRCGDVAEPELEQDRASRAASRRGRPPRTARHARRRGFDIRPPHL